MVVSARAKPRHGLIDETVSDLGLNDNSPGMHPGHELSDLRSAPRQPAAEAVLHYTRLSLIEPFPQDPRSASSGQATVPAMDENVEMQATGSVIGKRGVAIACVGSFICHAALVVALLVGFVVTPQAPVEEAGEAVSVIILGDSEADQAAAGEQAEEPQPEEIVAESVQPQTIQAAEVPPVAEPAQAEAVTPTQEVTRVSPENVTAVEPEILTSQAPAQSAVVQPMASEVPAEVRPEVLPLAPTPPAEVAPVQPTETAEISPEPDNTSKPDPKPVAEKPVQKPKPVEKKQPPKKAKVTAGSQGENNQDSKRGSADGNEAAASDQNSRSAGSRGGAGSAAVANYPGKVQSRIRRSVKVPTEYKRMSASTSVRIRLSIGSSGGISGLSVARSSGIPELDQAVVDGVRRAAPFPPLPAEWGKPVWTFTQEVQVTGR
jgi:protein TonB